MGPISKSSRTGVKLDTQALQQTRTQVNRAIEKRLGIQLKRVIPNSSALLSSPGRSINIACTISKCHKRGSTERYWYAYHRHWDKFLSQNPTSYLVLALLDKSVAFMIPLDVISGILRHLNKSKRPNGDVYWHIHLQRNSNDEYELLVPNVGSNKSLETFRIEYIRDQPIADDDIIPKPIENVSSAISFGWSSKGQLNVIDNRQNTPLFPYGNSKSNHAARLEASRTQASNLISDLSLQKYQVRSAYLETLRRYESSLPKSAGGGNILLSDAEARIIREIFQAEHSYLSPDFAARLKIFLEQHQSLRPYYKILEDFYAEVATGTLQEQLPYEATQGVVAGVKEFTPEVFKQEVPEALENINRHDPYIDPIEHLENINGTEDTILPPEDPIRSKDQSKAHNYLKAGVFNAFWKALISGEAVAKGIEGWRSAIALLKPFMVVILDWLSRWR